MQLHRRCFGFTRMIARWYRPLHDAFEAIRRSNKLPDYVTVPGVTSLQSLFQDEDPMHATVTFSARTSVERSSMLPPELIDAVVGCIGDPSSSPISGIRRLRHKVHQYLARQDLNHDGLIEAGDLGYGFARHPAVAMETGEEAFDLPEATEMIDQYAAYRMAGSYWPDAALYMNWWNGVVTRSGGLTARVTSEIVALSYGEGKEAEWLFNEIKKMAKIVILYGTGVVTPTRTTAALLLFIRQG